MVDARLRVAHPCPYCDVSTAFPRSLLLLWCDNRRDVFLVSSPGPAELRAVLRRMRSTLGARPILVEGPLALVVVRQFQWDRPPSVYRLAERAGLWTLPPIVYFAGRETYRFVAPTRRALDRLVRRLRRLGDVELLSIDDRSGLPGIRDVPAASVHFFEGLTGRQASALVAGFESGLFDVPGRSSWTEVARRQHLSRSTFGEHLRKGQRRILANSYGALKARVIADTQPIVLPALMPSRPDAAPDGPPGGRAAGPSPPVRRRAAVRTGAPAATPARR
jgi:predicted DNA binding protein